MILTRDEAWKAAENAGMPVMEMDFSPFPVFPPNPPAPPTSSNPLPEPCLICGKPVEGYVPEYCCAGLSNDCYCLGHPLNPCVCSDTCNTALMQGIGKSFDQRRIDAGIPLWKGL